MMSMLYDLNMILGRKIIKKRSQVIRPHNDLSPFKTWGVQVFNKNWNMSMFVLKKRKSDQVQR